MNASLIPWFESIPLGTASRRAAIPGRSLWYSTPVDEAVNLTGFHIVISYTGTLPRFTVQLCESRTPDIWSPFYSTPIEAIAGVDTGSVSPVRMLPAPYVISPGKRIQISLTVPTGYIIPGGNPADTLTLVGVRDLQGGVLNVAA